MAPRNRFSFALLLLGLSCAAPLAAQVITPPRVHWIGPDPATCDYPTIQDALNDIFNCGIFACPPGRNELRLSNGYTHFGQVVVNKSFDIRGSFLACEGASSGFHTTLNAPAGQPLFLIQPGSGSINNEFRFVSMVGSANATDNGGVIRMDAGDASLTLRDSRVQDGNATSGGGIYLSGDGNRLELIASTINLNQATSGGGIFCTNGGVIDFQSGFIQDNTAERSGGGVYLETDCELIGKTPRVDRQILRNTVTDSQQGEGGGIYALSAQIDMGALLSFTIIQQNVVGAVLSLHDYDQPGQNQGGGVHLESADATFYNTWFRENEAADGGAISASGASRLLVDRHSGPCRFGDDGNTVDCSLFEFNRARGGEENGGGEDEGGDGAVLFTQSASGSFPHATINRSTLRSNFASCFELNPPSFTGQCDLPTLTPGEIRISTQSIVSSVSEIVGNLIYNNSIGDDNNGLNNNKDGYHIEFAGTFAENTMAENQDSDGVFRKTPDQIINNIVWDFSPDEGVRGDRPAVISSCNVSNFAEEFDGLADSVPVASLDEDPLFVNPDLSTSPNEDFRVQMPSSPAIDRCDGQDGRLTLTYDIVGTPRGIDIAGIGDGPGVRDAGAFETLPAGFVNETADLVVNIESDLPKRAEIDERHAFTIEVTNTGRNAVSALRVELPTFALESLRGANAVDLSGNLTPVWDCNLGTGSCDYLLDTLIVGGGTTPITAEYAFPFSGPKTIIASVLMLDAALTELTPDNNEASDSVTVGPGADLEIGVVSAFPGEVALGEPQLFLIDVSNNGPEPATGMEVQIDLAASDGQIDSFDAFDWDCDIATAICTLPTTLQPDEQSRPNFNVNISYDQPGRKELTAIASATDGTGDPNSFNNGLVVFVDVLAPPTAELFADGFED